MSSKHFYPLVVEDIEKNTNDCVCINFAIPENLETIFNFSAGQNIILKKEIEGIEVRRNYSLCTAPHEKKVTVTVKKVASGKFSTYANEDLKKGDIIEVMAPTGNFTFSPSKNHNHVVFFAAGSGITPIISHIKTLLYLFPKIQISLFYGNRDINSIIFKEELEGLKNKYISRFSIFHIFTKEKVGIPLLHGRLDEKKCNQIFQKIFDPQKADEFFICGPAEMTFVIKKALLHAGINKENIHFELFNTTGIQPPKQENELNVNNNSPSIESSISIKIDGDIFEYSANQKGQSLLDAALFNGADLPYACKGGVCSTCKAKLIEGKVTMDVNYALEPDELEAGFILMCQSHPVSEKISIDYDQK